MWLPPGSRTTGSSRAKPIDLHPPPSRRGDGRGGGSKLPEPYHFVTDWRFKAPLQKVWSVVLDIERYPGWWKNFRRVQITRGDGKSVGSVIACEVRGSLPYSLNYAVEVTEAEEYRHILLRSTGDLVGTRQIGRASGRG